MKIIIFFLALLFSFGTLLNIVAASMRIISQAIIKKSTNTGMLPELIWGIISIALWTYFYYLEFFYIEKL